MEACEWKHKKFLKLWQTEEHYVTLGNSWLYTDMKIFSVDTADRKSAELV